MCKPTSVFQLLVIVILNNANVYMLMVHCISLKQNGVINVDTEVVDLSGHFQQVNFTLLKGRGREKGASFAKICQARIKIFMNGDDAWIGSCDNYRFYYEAVIG